MKTLINSPRYMFQLANDQHFEDPRSQDIFTHFQHFPNQLSISTNRFKIICTEIQTQNQDLYIYSLITHTNGRPFTINPPFSHSFIEAVRCKTPNINITLHPRNHTIQFEYCLPKSLNMQLEVIKLTYMDVIISEIQTFESILSSFGKISKFGSSEIKLKGLQIQMKRKIVDILNKKKLAVPKSFSDSQKNIDRSCPVIPIKSIQQIQCMRKQKKPSFGGYCSVEPIKCLVTKHEEENSEELILAVKKSKFPLNTEIISKIKYEKEIIKHLPNSQYFCKYYTMDKNPHIYMQFAPVTLRKVINCSTGPIDIQMIINIASSIVSGVKSLHQSKVIHRDLKPENILLHQSDDNESKIKIIDFGQSTLSTIDPSQANLKIASSFPYSPIECVLGDIEGFNNKQIDSWSVSIILYELAFRSVPLSFNELISNSIVNDWKTSPLFTVYLQYRKNRGIAGISEIISLIGIAGLQVKQSDRLSLDQLESIMDTIQQYYTKCVHLE